RTYPFDIREKLKKAPKDHQVLVVGRFLRDRLGHPRNWFEVWDVRIGLHRSQEEIVRRLRDPIEIRFPSAEAAEVAAFLRWYGVELSIGGIDDRSRIGIEGVDCPLGLLIDELARALGASWYLDGARVVLCPEEQNRRRSEMAAVIDRLHAINEGTVSASLAAAPLPEEEKGAAAPLSPGATDPLKLREEAVAAMAGMRYGEALTLYERLLAIPGYAEEWPELLGTSFRARLFDAMTATTPVSRLGEAGDLTRLTIRNREGEVFEQTVEVVGRDDSYLWVQPSYGGEIRVPGGWVRREDPILAREWRQRKREELSVLEQRLEEPGSRESLHARYMLALFCKTYRFEGRGNDCLEDAIGDDEFEWLIGTYFPKRHHELLGYWRRATGRASPDEQLAGGEILFGDDEEEEEEQEEAAAAPPRREVAKAPRRPRPAPGASSAEIEKLFEAAQKEIEAGRRCLSRSLPGMKDASKQRRDALRHFQAAEKHVRKLIRKGESNEDTRELLNRITVLVQTCLKDLGFFD
ncbi:MAG: hypothetical protein ACE5GW_06490, partial [Planctomycetota bacterium]